MERIITTQEHLASLFGHHDSETIVIEREPAEADLQPSIGLIGPPEEVWAKMKPATSGYERATVYSPEETTELLRNATIVHVG